MKMRARPTLAVPNRLNIFPQTQSTLVQCTFQDPTYLRASSEGSFNDCNHRFCKVLQVFLTGFFGFHIPKVGYTDSGF